MDKNINKADMLCIDQEINKEIYNTCSFEKFWKIYPRKVSKKAAKKAWSKIKLTEELCEKILTALKNQIDNNWKGKDKQYIPHASTWLNGERWDDEIEVKKEQKGTNNFNGEDIDDRWFQ